MGKKIIRSFEDLEVYKLARKFSDHVSQLTKKLPNIEEYNLKHQMRRAKLSMTNNIAEGFGRYHYQENMQFCRQSRGSVCELIDDFIECYANGYINENERNELKDEAYQLIKVLNGYIASIKRQKARDPSASKRPDYQITE
ncbi:MAG TPA: four helix bundle protein [Thermodesulfobacteriota bacterium]|nr:four helix bundle protein [Thermodesulfobacteriota bacterium]HVP78395.1 four helix bundle protein [Thermodesulfobacteriota bacterium]